MRHIIITCATFLCFALGSTACQAGEKQNHLDVYKTPSCGCCVEWIDHMTAFGFEATAHHPDDLSAIKESHGIGSRYGSCHTAVSAQGYVFEGHVPARFVKQFLANPPEEAIGLSVPGMPVGSPGMEYEDKFMPYEVLLLNKDGTSSVFVKVESYEAQFD